MTAAVTLKIKSIELFDFRSRQTKDNSFAIVAL